MQARVVVRLHRWSSWRKQYATGAVSFTGHPAHLVDCSDQAVRDSRDFVLLPDFITLDEEKSLLDDVSSSFKRARYQYAHWDQAIEGYREAEKGQWQKQNQTAISRLMDTAAKAVQGKTLVLLPAVHVLDLAKDGFIRPHVDSIKHCGEVIAGVSLLSPAIMRLQCEDDSAKWINALLLPRSLYILRGIIRHKYTHAILGQKDSEFRGNTVLRDRRISLVCRTVPQN